jgi:3-phenylpropionate/trans-cinnamate dioxygenase ferredoxin subunit
MLAFGQREGNRHFSHFPMPTFNISWLYRAGFTRMEDANFVAVATTESIEEKSFCTFNINGVSLLICRFRDQYYAMENLCSHAYSTFDDGRLRGYRIMCPLHGATFDIRDGACTGAPATKPIKSYPVRIKNGMIEADLKDHTESAV